eukprot:1140828-Pelagomonas_calceolata.AAC.6
MLLRAPLVTPPTPPPPAMLPAPAWACLRRSSCWNRRADWESGAEAVRLLATLGTPGAARWRQFELKRGKEYWSLWRSPRAQVLAASAVLACSLPGQFIC